jgi:type IV fimbrial biogenesis protein FimT
VTLTEILIVMLIVSVLGAMAAPAFNSFTSRSSATSAEAEFVNALNFSRSEAMRRAVNVVVTAASPTTGTDSFGAGWTVWVDANGDGTFGAGDTLLRNEPPFTQGVTLGNGNVNQVAFNSQGYLVNAGPLTYSTCNTANAGQQGYTVTILQGGIVDVADSVTC